jgi:hypothetical protein
VRLSIVVMRSLKNVVLAPDVDNDKWVWSSDEMMIGRGNLIPTPPLHHKSHVDCPWVEIKPWLCCEMTTANRLSYIPAKLANKYGKVIKFLFTVYEEIRFVFFWRTQQVSGTIILIVFHCYESSGLYKFCFNLNKRSVKLLIYYSSYFN